MSKRSDTVCNFLESGRVSVWGKDTKVIYRHYAKLYFIFAVDKSESELGILDLIQVFVECLDRCFENVCELDLIFHAPKVHYILDEIIMGGMVLEHHRALFPWINRYIHGYPRLYMDISAPYTSTHTPHNTIPTHHHQIPNTSTPAAIVLRRPVAWHGRR